MVFSSNSKSNIAAFDEDRRIPPIRVGRTLLLQLIDRDGEPSPRPFPARGGHSSVAGNHPPKRNRPGRPQSERLRAGHDGHDLRMRKRRPFWTLSPVRMAPAPNAPFVGGRLVDRTKTCQGNRWEIDVSERAPHTGWSGWTSQLWQRLLAARLGDGNSWSPAPTPP